MDDKNDGIVHFIDDEKDIVRVLTAALEKKGYSVHSFDDPIEALEDIRGCSKKCRVVISDVRMPKLSGIKMVGQVKAINPNIPVVLMTAFEINKNEFDSLFPNVPADDFIKKPFAMRELLEIVEKHKAQN